MNILKQGIGKLIYVTSLTIYKFFDLIIIFLEASVSLVKSIMSLFFGLVMVGGCFLLLILIGPVTLTLLTNPRLLITVIFLLIYPLLGTILTAYSKYLKYMITEYLFDYANFLIDGKERRFNSFLKYGEEYKRFEYERKERERRERQYQQQKQWEETFRRWQQQSGYGQGHYGQYNWHGNHNTHTNPNVNLKQKYEESCDILNVDYNADKDEIRKAFRKMAKKYHPDINDSPEATKTFKKINNAYEFLSDNIERYKNIQ
ncbi:J domain-containing protein [Natranaerobius thermophilus]|uniref:Heat shock protein DnaJ domain protein n=1 Tax=Natranaerobius thermophilus (strain ATCC BAA-1301 / DSM 18059 / JW/NM-WN-LF) TaxID=457570 RepID=B2A5A8_NATTJ|nr:J domain-containing protein [Natranaerobius thermophilus]ACB83942.1 heat shock protein DnaJ domain protein [Natranaerobius thermophilus JW/NM-WN-LF]